MREHQKYLLWSIVFVIPRLSLSSPITSSPRQTTLKFHPVVAWSSKFWIFDPQWAYQIPMSIPLIVRHTVFASHSLSHTQHVMYIDNVRTGIAIHAQHSHCTRAISTHEGKGRNGKHALVAGLGHSGILLGRCFQALLQDVRNIP